MKKVILTIIIATLSVFFLTDIAQAQIGGGIGPTNFLKKTGDVINFTNSNYKFGSGANKIEEINVKTLNADSAVVSQIDMSGCGTFSGSNTSTICGDGSQSIIGAELLVKDKTRIEPTGNTALEMFNNGSTVQTILETGATNKDAFSQYKSPSATYKAGLAQSLGNTEYVITNGNGVLARIKQGTQPNTLVMNSSSVGIGTSTPSAGKLHVYGSTNGNTGAIFEDSSGNSQNIKVRAAASQNSSVQLESGSDDTGWNLVNGTSLSNPAFALFDEVNNNIVFRALEGTKADTLSINQNGVGVNTTTQSKDLTVAKTSGEEIFGVDTTNEEVRITDSNSDGWQLTGGGAQAKLTPVLGGNDLGGSEIVFNKDGTRYSFEGFIIFEREIFIGEPKNASIKPSSGDTIFDYDLNGLGTTNLVFRQNGSDIASFAQTGDFVLQDDVQSVFGADYDYSMGYDSGELEWELTDINGEDIINIDDGSKEVNFTDDISVSNTIKTALGTNLVLDPNNGAVVPSSDGSVLLGVSGMTNLRFRGAFTNVTAVTSTVGSLPMSQPSDNFNVYGTSHFAGDHTQYGSMSTSSNPTATTINTQDVYEEINVFDVGLTRGFTFSSSNLTATVTGTYKIDYDTTLQASNNNDVFELAIFVNGSEQQRGTCKTAAPNTGFDNCSNHSLIELNSGDVVDLRVRNTSGADNVLVQESNFVITQQ